VQQLGIDVYNTLFIFQQNISSKIFYQLLKYVPLLYTQIPQHKSKVKSPIIISGLHKHQQDIKVMIKNTCACDQSKFDIFSDHNIQYS